MRTSIVHNRFSRPWARTSCTAVQPATAVAKVANNMLLGISMIGVAEAMALGVALGMDAKTLAGVINTSSGRCWSSDTYNPFPGVLDNVPASRGYSGGFGSDLMLMIWAWPPRPPSRCASR